MLAYLGAVDAWAANPAVRPLFFDRSPECAALTLRSAVIQLAAPVWDPHPNQGVIAVRRDWMDRYLASVAWRFLLAFWLASFQRVKRAPPP
jgi:hypothetical protein